MAGVASVGSRDSRLYNGVSSRLEGESSREWQSSEQLENGTPSTSPPFWNTDDDDEDCGPSPSQLYGTYTWTIDKFSQINKRELRSDAFEVGGYKWYILIYPQGCDVCNHLSLFLCVANHDKLLPGWSHFAQFTIAVVNTDAKKSKHSDTLHRFWKKEHDWGWKKFMELTKVLDGFVEDDKLTIKAQVQVIREKADRPFRCLGWNYRRELVRVYWTNVEQIFHRFVEERRNTLGKLIGDKVKWASFCSFWLGIDQKSKRNMTKERTDSILRVVVKQFFIEKEVTSTLVMDSLHSGLKALERQIKNKKICRNLLGSEKLPIPVVHIDRDMFVLVDDVLLLLERVALEPLPPKGDKGPQNRMKDGSLGDECRNESQERDLIRLTELGRRTIEMFVVDHIFSCKIEVAYQEGIALKRQEELIREEEVWLEIEQKSKRGAADKEKKSKKKQGKQKRNNRKGKDKGRDAITIANALDKLQLDIPDESKAYMAEETKPELVRPETYEDVSDVSDTVNHVTELLHPNAEERKSSKLSPVQNGESNGSCTVVDDSSSTCSTDSVPPMAMNGFLKANNSLPHQENHRSPTRENKQRDRASSDMSGWVSEVRIRPSDVKRDLGSQNDSSGSRKAESEPKAATESLQDKLKKVEPQVVKGQLASHRTEPMVKHQFNATVSPSSSIGSTKHTPSPIQLKLEPTNTDKISIKRLLSDNPQLAPSVTKSADRAPHKSVSPPKPTEKQEIPSIMSRPSSAPIVPGPRPTTPVVSIVQSQPLLSRSMSAVGTLGPNTTSSPHHHQSYRNAMMGTNVVTPPTSTSSGYTHQPMYFNPTQANSMYPPMFRTIDHPFVQNDVPAPDIFNQVRISSRNSQLGDEFPHLDIINDLLDDEYGTSTSTNFRSFDGGSQPLNRQFYPGNIGIMTSEMLVAPSSNSSRFQRTHSYHENRFQPNYSSFGDPFVPTRDFFLQPSLRPFPNQWQVEGSDCARTSDGSSGYGYHIPDYSNLAGNSNGYSLYRPSNGQ